MMIKVFVPGYSNLGSGRFGCRDADNGQQHQQQHGKENHDGAVIVF